MVFGCVDSRVVPEIVFDRGLGDLFVIRTAGQVIDGAVLGSVEFGAVALGIPLVVVLGHERCGAVIATIEALEAGTPADGSMATIVEAIAPAVERSSGEGDELPRPGSPCQHPGRGGSAPEEPCPQRTRRRGRLAIVGAHYAVGSGIVDFMVDQ